MELLELGKQPISEQEPAGKDVRFEPDMEALSAEIDKLSSPTASGSIDWGKVAELARKILGEESKDLLVSCYLCLALFETEKLRGLGAGIHVIRDLLENFWETLFPPKKRMRGRKNAIEWWVEKSLAVLQADEPEQLPPEEIDAMCQDLHAIDEFISENIPDAPMLKRFQDAISSMKMKAAESEPMQPETATQESPESEPVSRETPKSVAAPATALSGSIQTEEDAHRFLHTELGKLREVATYFMTHNLFHPLIYRINRIAAWMPVEGLPPSTENKTRIPPPPQLVTNALRTLYEGGDWQNLLKTAESRFGEFLFWLDLNRYVAESLDKLGHSELQDLVSQETSHYVRRLKGIENLSFSDGTPFADTDTKGWIKQFTAESASDMALGFSSGADGAGDSIQAKIAETVANAKALIKEKKTGDAVQQLHQPLRDAFSGKEKLLWRIALMQLLISAKKAHIALPHLNEIFQEVESHRLEQWDPDLALQALIGAYTGYIAQKEDKHKEKAAEILNRIAGLSPAHALRMGV